MWVLLSMTPSNHGSAFDQHTGAVIDFHCRPTLKDLLRQLEKLGKQCSGRPLRLRYEASYLGYTLQQDLAHKVHHGDVVAPTSIPTPCSKHIKADCLDAAQLAQFYATHLLTFACIPEPALEQDRDLLRSRKHLQALLRRHELHDKAQTISATSGSLKVNLRLVDDFRTFQMARPGQSSLHSMRPHAKGKPQS